MEVSTDMLAPFPCARCTREIGRTDGARLVLGIVVAGRWLTLATIRQRVKLYCPDCGAGTVWHEPKALTTRERACYTSS
jgi:predicted RNA-binding Zn-ribbon protein involved in translation (DUF1610 family)